MELQKFKQIQDLILSKMESVETLLGNYGVYVMKLEAKVEKMKPYLHHKPNCVWNELIIREIECDCGLPELYKQLTQQPKGKE